MFDNMLDFMFCERFAIREKMSRTKLGRMFDDMFDNMPGRIFDSTMHQIGTLSSKHTGIALRRQTGSLSSRMTKNV